MGKGGRLSKSEHREAREESLRELDRETRPNGNVVEERLEAQPHGGALKRERVVETPDQKQARLAARDVQREMREGKNGGKLLTGNPGNKGGGRKSDEWRAKMEALGNDPRSMAYLRRCLRGRLGAQAHIAAYKYVTEQAHGKAKIRAEIQGGDRPVEIIVRKE